jgi:hypothetical protein
MWSALCIPWRTHSNWRVEPWRVVFSLVSVLETRLEEYLDVWLGDEGVEALKRIAEATLCGEKVEIPRHLLVQTEQ